MSMAESPVTDYAFVGLNDLAVRAGYIYLAERQDIYYDGGEHPLLGGGIHVLRLIDPDWRPDPAPTGPPDN